MAESVAARVASLRRFLGSPSGGACVLLLASLAGFVLANSPWAAGYTALTTTPLTLSVLGKRGPDTIDAWVSDGFMTLFFLVVILEIKTEIVTGHLSSPRRVALPLIGALGGMIVPALTYLLVTCGHPEATRGWAIPVATDAAFTLPIILALGRHVSAGARAWLMALAIFDDVLGIVVIAVFYGNALYWPALAAAVVVTAALIGANRIGIRTVWGYATGCILLWIALLGSGLHPTLAGVITGLCLPATALGRNVGQATPLDRAASALTPVVTWVILPLFGFMNVGVSLRGIHPDMMVDAVPLGIMSGLLIGKPVGVFSATLLSTRLRIATLPAETSMGKVFGLSLLCGIGFTISLFIANLSFPDSGLVIPAKMGIFAGSVLSALAGWLWLRFSPEQ
ncbi:Na+/H+ antiporter NhaA [Gluconacetobacter diazotrophicus PA1 5]|uniref:Na(+)/H(+) antiporter NhaA n=1 Tax=Gluconacetobacter diazotrophicus (strain ATCC 49037 / DSM 5601 / CCUG 37298 / CIP 103539 / LMG 7603 / PAl5) TaxID=272568 RepID=NHAA_GLUDA|nr:Na+/H+ antiporter NhaA [Gluconacetobacter diazotrophicus]A9H2L4.1 RecName: Full=Na(+)/H(+) antiporter NhaA; AltName: Full=Sodium/proton antiporter NhaA [Gluconacetobacter diazotrophicus PA1 5]ACI52048.1 Na+/H+ antiporter NhaA [Gluconacetobacter diazotrophicus PA1 5]TWB03089.1 sodium/proton antiporter (NhaA family) [Gluconacetobacter diazotrophicus]CAP54167.1 putative Na(+)/H(+) antiporter 1 [Gluconacetobacter diazotrophicus PA1 5]